MATIYTPQPPPPQQFQQQQSQSAPIPSNDPLFDALVKYITATPGATSTTQEQLQSIIDDHSETPGGRAYLESIVAPDPIADSRVWVKSAPVDHGFFSTNMSRLNMVFSVGPEADLSVRGTAQGFFPPFVSMIERGTFLWDELDTSRGDIKTSFEIIVLPQWRQIIVNFYPEVYTPENKKAIAELIVYESDLRLPPQGVKGYATLTPMFRKQ